MQGAQTLGNPYATYTLLPPKEEPLSAPLSSTDLHSPNHCFTGSRPSPKKANRVLQSNWRTTLVPKSFHDAARTIKRTHDLPLEETFCPRPPFKAKADWSDYSLRLFIMRIVTHCIRHCVLIICSDHSLTDSLGIVSIRGKYTKVWRKSACCQTEACGRAGFVKKTNGEQRATY